MRNVLKCVKCNIAVGNSLLCDACHAYDIKLGEAMNTRQICSECDEEADIAQDGMCNICIAQVNEDDFIKWPKHYNTGKIQPIEAIEDWKLDFRLANAVKYIARCEHKGKTKLDLEKAIWYIERYIKIELDKDVNND